ncbi:MAG: type II and III secretion system family protein [Rhodospirillales bacterium]|nr:type II and III secretion system family protein [Rhodospirillales bacterium]
MTISFLMALLMVSGCDLARNQVKMDRAANMEFQDFRDALEPNLDEQDMAADEDGAGIPDMKPYMAQPSDDLKAMPLVSVSVNQTVPVRDVLYDLAREADYDIELDPRIRGSIIFSAREKPFDVVVDRIAEIAGLRYKFNDHSLRVELDTPYNKTYKIDYLSYVRKNKSSISNNVAVMTGGGTNTGSQFTTEAESESDFWGELSANIEQILGVAPSTGTLKSNRDPQVTAVEQNPAPVAPVVTEGEDGAPEVQVQAPEAVLQVSSVANDDLEDDEQAKKRQPMFTVNRQAGLVSVYGTERQQKEIFSYLEEVRRSVTAQVLIEAKVMEVALTDEYAAGINWNAVLGNSGKGNIGFDVTGDSLRPSLDPVTSPGANFLVSYLGSDLSAAVEAISRFGTVRSLSSPRMTVLNNQSAVLNVAKNEVYFEIDIDVTAATDTTAPQTEIQSEIRNVPEGVLINVQPSINLDDRTVSMAIRPTVTKIVDRVPDPGVLFVVRQAAADAPGIDLDGVESLIPVINVQEMDSVISMPSGQTVIMGGLMQDEISSEHKGVPVLSELPILGSAFRTQSDKIQKTELVIFLKATIMDGGSNVHPYDKELYKKFSGDRRAATF